MFPYSCILRAHQFAAAVYVDKFHSWRISITYPLLNHARRLMFLVAGADKADMLRRIHLDPPGDDPVPIQRIAAQGAVEWLLDSAAAAHLPKGADIMKVLAGDLGGTKTLLMIGECRGAQVSSLYEQRYDSAAFSNLLPMVQTFLRDAGDHAQGVERACIAVAGPVSESPDGQSASITNLPWRFDSGSLAAQLGIARVRLVNDFQGVGYGIEALGEEDIVTLQMGTPRACGPRVVLGAGTGLGEGVLVWAHDFYEVLPSEGGHADFAPTDAEQIELLRALLTDFDHVSCERLICGQGLVRIYEFLRARHVAPESEALRDAMAEGDAAAAISAAALAKTDRLAQAALDLFVRLVRRTGRQSRTYRARHRRCLRRRRHRRENSRQTARRRLHESLSRQRPHGRTARRYAGTRGDQSPRRVARRCLGGESFINIGRNSASVLRYWQESPALRCANAVYIESWRHSRASAAAQCLHNHHFIHRTQRCVPSRAPHHR